MALSFKEYHKEQTIGTGAYKFREYSGLAQLATPQNVAADGTTVSWDSVENATQYDIYADDNYFGTVEPS